MSLAFARPRTEDHSSAPSCPFLSIYDPAGAEGEAGGGPPVDNPALTGTFDEGAMEAGNLTRPSPQMQRDPALPMPMAADMRVQDLTLGLALSAAPGLGLCTAFG